MGYIGRFTTCAFCTQIHAVVATHRCSLTATACTTVLEIYTRARVSECVYQLNDCPPKSKVGRHPSMFPPEPGPEPDRTGTGTGPESEPDRNRTGTEPEPDRNRTGPEPDQNRISCNSIVATVLLQQYCCNSTVATVLLQQYCRNKKSHAKNQVRELSRDCSVMSVDRETYGSPTFK